MFGQSTESAAAIASIFGWMNLFARGLGGVLSDSLNESYGMKGRLWAQVVMLLLEGVAVVAFAHTHSLAGSVVVLVFFSLCVQASEGCTFGLVPYVMPRYMGSVSGIVGAGGNAGAVGFGLCFKYMTYERAFVYMGTTIIISSTLTAFIRIKGHAGLFFGEDLAVDNETGEIVELAVDDSDHNLERRKVDDPLV